jgi:ABC-type nickel/cobalt efflux system permease component RcnA
LFATLFTSNASFWLANRLELIASALVLLVAAWWFLRHAEWRFFGEEVVLQKL